MRNSSFLGAILVVALALGACASPGSAEPRPRKLAGIGLVVGLENTGTNDPGARQAVRNYLRAQGVNLAAEDMVPGSVALVSLTCELPVSAVSGQLLDVECEIQGDSTSLRGGELLRAELRGEDDQIHVVAQGAVLTHGLAAGTADASMPASELAHRSARTGWLPRSGVVVRSWPGP
jgi:flagellar P-ring protein FlgI